MNTKKALIVIMVLLVLLNAVMVGYIISLNVKNNDRIDSDEYTVEILRQRNIEMNCLIPDSTPDTATISLGDMLYTEDSINLLKTKTGGDYKIDSFGRLQYWGAADEIVIEDDMNRAAVEQISHDFINNLELQLDDYTLDYTNEIGTDEYDVRYIKKDSRGNHYYDIYIEMIITEYGVVSAEISIRNIEEREENNGDGLPIHAILLANLVSESKPMIINNISYGYHQKKTYSSEAVMSWRVRFNDGSERFFDVGTGEEVTPVIQILEFNNVIFECSLPDTFIGADEIVYGPSRFTQEQLDSMQVFIDGQVTIDSYGLINYIRTSFENSTRYTLTNEIMAELATGFIENLGLNPANYVLDSLETVSDGSHKTRYIYSDADGNLLFENFIEIHLSDLGIVFASFRLDEYSEGIRSVDFVSLSAVLLEHLDIISDNVFVITNIDSGYIRETIISENAIACWRVIYDDGNVQYFSVVTGEELIVD